MNADSTSKPAPNDSNNPTGGEGSPGHLHISFPEEGREQLCQALAELIDEKERRH